MTNNPFESTLIAAEEIEVLIYYSCYLVIIIQLFIALCANVVHHFELPRVKILEVGGGQWVGHLQEEFLHTVSKSVSLSLSLHQQRRLR